MPLRLLVSALAKRDLDHLFAFIAEVSSSFVADRFLNRLIDRCQRLCAAPGAGSRVAGTAAIRKINEGPYKIFYRATESELIILRIWDGRRSAHPRLGSS